MTKVIEVLAESLKGWDDAAAKARREAERKLHLPVKSVRIQDRQAVVDSAGHVVQYRINARVAVDLEQPRRVPAVSTEILRADRKESRRHTWPS